MIKHQIASKKKKKKRVKKREKKRERRERRKAEQNYGLNLDGLSATRDESMALKHLLKMNPLKALSTVISLTLRYTCKTQTMLYNSKLDQSRPATSEHHFWSGVGDHQVTFVSSSAASAKMREAETVQI